MCRATHGTKIVSQAVSPFARTALVEPPDRMPITRRAAENMRVSVSACTVFKCGKFGLASLPGSSLEECCLLGARALVLFYVHGSCAVSLSAIVVALHAWSRSASSLACCRTQSPWRAQTPTHNVPHAYSARGRTAPARSGRRCRASGRRTAGPERALTVLLAHGVSVCWHLRPGCSSDERTVGTSCRWKRHFSGSPSACLVRRRHLLSV